MKTEDEIEVEFESWWDSHPLPADLVCFHGRALFCSPCFLAWQACQQLNDEVIATKDAEIARLREALQAIIDLPSCELNMYNYHYDDVCALNNQYVEIYNIATQTLEKNNDK